jgi:hypothetical protein
MFVLFGRGDRRLSEALRARIPSGAAPRPGGLLGLELEFSARSQGGGRVHFGSLIHRLALDGHALDPGDPNAYRCSWGGVITSDGAEAEIAIPPVWTRPGFTRELQAWAELGQAELLCAVPRGVELDGYSAHFSAAMPAGLNDRVCRLYAETFAADLMLLTHHAGSPGLLLRPRPGRTELCGEFINGESLPAVAAFVAGSTKACAQAIGRPGARTTLLPPRLSVRPDKAVHRYGWYVDRGAFGPDLLADSRRTLLPRAAGGTISAQSHLELAWAAARGALAGDAAASDMRAADAMVTGSLPLPSDYGQQAGTRYNQPAAGTRFTGGETARKTTALLQGRHVRPGFTIRPVTATWDFAVFEASGPARRAYACVPRNCLPGFADALDEGALDDTISAYLALPPHRRVLAAHQQTGRPGLYDRMGPPTALLAPERDPQTGRYESVGRGAKRTLTRPGKRNGHERPKGHGRLAWKAVTVGVAVAVLLAGAGAAMALRPRGHGQPNGHHLSLLSFHPPALSFPETRISSTVTSSLIMTNPGSRSVVVTGMRVAGPARHDFSVALQDSGPGHRSGQAAGPTALPTLPCLQSLQPGRSCEVKVIFTPSAVGLRSASLGIYVASRRQPQNVPLTGTGFKPRHQPPVAVTGISPAAGPAAGGTTVTITGSGFTGATGVSFGSSQATTFTFHSDTQITATSPPGTGTVAVTVRTPRGHSAPGTGDQFTYITPLAVTGVKPGAGSTAGGTTVTITGSGFTGAKHVYFGSASALFTIHSDTQIIATSPPGTGTVAVTVSTPSGHSTPGTSDQFTYITPPAVTGVKPAIGGMAGGTTAFISGSGFTGAKHVYFGGASALFTFHSDNSITATSPPGTSPGTVDITVVTAGGQSAHAKADQFTYVAPPVVTAVTPKVGKTPGGLTVTITGSGFTGVTSVYFGGASALFTFHSDSQITATSPPSAVPSTVDITVVTTGGPSAHTKADQFTYL